MMFHMIQRSLCSHRISLKKYCCWRCCWMLWKEVKTKLRSNRLLTIPIFETWNIWDVYSLIYNHHSRMTLFMAYRIINFVEVNKECEIGFMKKQSILIDGEYWLLGQINWFFSFFCFLNRLNNLSIFQSQKLVQWFYRMPQESSAITFLN